MALLWMAFLATSCLPLTVEGGAREERRAMETQLVLDFAKFYHFQGICFLDTGKDKGLMVVKDGEAWRSQKNVE